MWVSAVQSIHNSSIYLLKNDFEMNFKYEYL